jgi:predicted metal-dependent hydrolase
MQQISLGNISIDVIRKNIKNIHLAVYPPTGRVRLAAPMKVNDDAIRLFAISKLGWIKRQQRKFQGQERLSPREYKNRESHYVRGQRYLLNVIEEDVPPRVILRSKTYIDLYVRPKTPTAKRHEIMNEWYRAELKKQLPDLIKRWSQRLNIKINQCLIKHMKTKWGSCNIEKRRVWINLELAKKPIHCLEYILVHEMTHLLERHHNTRFSAYMDKYLPQWRSYKQDLNEFPVSHIDWKY